MQDITVVLLGAGSATRFQSDIKKQWLRIGERPLWQKVQNDYEAFGFKNIVIVSSREDFAYMQRFTGAKVVIGGKTRQKSLQNALDAVQTPYVLVSDIARCCFDRALINRVLAKQQSYDCVVPFTKVNDTVYLDDEVINRDAIKLIQTPQLSRTQILKKALHSAKLFTDDSSAIKAAGGSVGFVEGSPKAHKLTRVEDLGKLDCLSPPSDTVFTGIGYDTHAFEKGKQMVLCGVEMEHELGFKAHSDGDVALHAVIDALMGAACMGDIGELFPDSDESFAGADSKMLLDRVVLRLRSYGYIIDNIDLTIIAQIPKISPYKDEMRQILSTVCKCDFVNVKATTAEKMGFVGRKEGVAVQACATLRFHRWERE